MSRFSDSELRELLAATVSVAGQAGEIIARDIVRPKNIRRKGRIDLVTETDLAVEEFLKQSLREVLPEADFLAEETAGDTQPGKLTWILDPLDGTTNFAHGLPFVCSSLALWADDAVVLGVINAPVLGECFSAAQGLGAYLGGERIRVSLAERLEDSLVATGFPYGIHAHVESIKENLGRVLTATQGVRRCGAAAIDLAYTACGRFDGFYEAALNPWDVAAGWILVREAGGQVSTFDSSTSYRLGQATILATNGLIHEELGRLLAL